MKKTDPVGPGPVGPVTPGRDTRSGRRATPDEMRQYRRSEHRQPVRVAVRDKDQRLVDQGWAEVSDLSPSGVRIHGLRLHRETELTDEHRLVLDIVFEDGSMYVEVLSAPRWVDEAGCMGLEFDAVDVRVV